MYNLKALYSLEPFVYALFSRHLQKKGPHCLSEGIRQNWGTDQNGTWPFWELGVANLFIYIFFSNQFQRQSQILFLFVLIDLCVFVTCFVLGKNSSEQIAVFFFLGSNLFCHLPRPLSLCFYRSNILSSVLSGWSSVLSLKKTKMKETKRICFRWLSIG